MSSTKLGSLDSLLELLNKLDTFNVVKAFRSDDELHFSNGLKAIYRVKTHKHKHSTMTFQAVLYIKDIEIDNGYMPYAWGCTTEDENTLLVRWFYEKCSLSLVEERERVDSLTVKIRKLIEE